MCGTVKNGQLEDSEAIFKGNHRASLNLAFLPYEHGKNFDLAKPSYDISTAF
ncbi:hypothetical protein [Clostridium manihotivorum]|uniref:hypothetical protein n=1 Tax=Clostridium manihotivorum TaxID=2320868 RepID=UPI0013E3D688|nr:hypothetical protein [Clostridium manihotivorum]